MGILTTLIALGIVIFIHELGHMLAARAVGIRVFEFSVGMGPKIFSRTPGETTYSLRVFPIGGFVRLAGMDNGKKAPKGQNFQDKSVWARALTIVAGPLMNVLLGFAIFVVIFSLIGVPTQTPQIKSVLEGSPAQQAGILPNDIVKTVNGVQVENVAQDMIAQIREAKDKPVAVVVDRNGTQAQFTIIPKWNETHSIPMIGVVLGTKTVRYGPIESVGRGLVATTTNIRMVFLGLGAMFANDVPSRDITGPIGIIQVMSAQWKAGLLQFLGLCAMINISLAIINLVPLPVLDGGHLLLLGIEVVRKKQLSKRWETAINNVGAIIILILMALIITNDVRHWQDRNELLNQTEIRP